MKVKLIDGNVFKPITLKITIQTQNELLSIWHRFNISTNQLQSTMLPECNYKEKDVGCIMEVWNILDRILKERNIEP